MLPSLSGNRIQNSSHVFNISDSTVVGEVRRLALARAESLNFSEVRLGRVGIVVNELGNNLSKYAQDGKLVLRCFAEDGIEGLEILSIDKGPGFNTDDAMVDGFSSGSTPGTGLGAIRRLSDVFDFYSSAPGSVLVARIYAQDSMGNAQVRYTIGSVNVPIYGETVCGDSWSVEYRDDMLRVLVVDGLGHGVLAHQAAQEACDVFAESGPSATAPLLSKIHGRLKSTRGGAVFLANIHKAEIEYLGAGNIRAYIAEPLKLKSLISHNGTAGVQIKSNKALSQAWSGHENVIFMSDGITSKWDLTKCPGILNRHPSIVAAVIYRDFVRGTDDATVLVVRFN